MRQSVWTRERLLLEEQDSVIAELVQDQKGITAELENDDWMAAKASGWAIMKNCKRMLDIERELEMVQGLIDTFERITKRMEELEKANGIT